MIYIIYIIYIYIYIHIKLSNYQKVETSDPSVSGTKTLGMPTPQHPTREGHRLQRSPDAVRNKNALDRPGGGSIEQKKNKIWAIAINML